MKGRRDSSGGGLLKAVRPRIGTRPAVRPVRYCREQHHASFLGPLRRQCQEGCPDYLVRQQFRSQQSLKHQSFRKGVDLVWASRWFSRLIKRISCRGVARERSVGQAPTEAGGRQIPTIDRYSFSWPTTWLIWRRWQKVSVLVCGTRSTRSTRQHPHLEPSAYGGFSGNPPHDGHPCPQQPKPQGPLQFKAANESRVRRVYYHFTARWVEMNGRMR
jgi:hypothetical protein